MTADPTAPNPANPQPEPNAAASASSASPRRRVPSHWSSVCLLAKVDLEAMARSWLCRGFLLASALFTLLMLKAMQAEQKVASQMLEAIYATYLLVWMHGVIFVAGGALTREADCLNDAILCRGLTRGEYILGKLIARCLAVLLMVGGVLLPTSFWAIRQDKLVRTDDGYVTSAAKNTKVEAWEPKRVFAQVAGTLKEITLKLGDAVRSGDVLATLDDRTVFDELETERRSEENARNEVGNARRRFEDAKRAVAQAEDALVKAERGLIAKDLLSKVEQADRETDIRARKRDLKNAESQLRVAEDAIPTTERAVENAESRVRDSRRRLGYATITAPVSGYLTEVLAHSAQFVSVGAQLFTVAPLDDYQISVPIYKYDEFKRLKLGLSAYVRIEHTEYKGTIDRLGAMTQPDRWGRECNYAIVRFKGDGTLGLLGLPADVRLVLPPPKERANRVTAILNVLTGHGAEGSASRTASVTTGWMLVGFGKVMGCAFLLVATTLMLLMLFRNALTAILGVVGLWHISNLLFDFAGLKELSYLEMVSTMDKVLSGVTKPVDEFTTLAWLFGFTVAFGALAIAMFVSRDPVR